MKFCNFPCFNSTVYSLYWVKVEGEGMRGRDDPSKALADLT